jgi:intracellular septation protein
MNSAKKQLLEFAPLLIFFLAYWKFGFIWATGALVAATLAMVLILYLVEGKIAKVQVLTTLLVLVFGGLTLYFKDPVFIKIKVSVINLLFAGLLMGGLGFGKLFIRDLLGQSLAMPDDAWRSLTWRWGMFFVALAFLNIVVWQVFSEQVWLTFKVFGLMGLTLLFALANAPFMMKHMTDTDENPSANG